MGSAKQYTSLPPTSDPEMAELIAAAEVYVKDFMSQHDPSHDFSHIMRVVRLATYIYDCECADHPEEQSRYDRDVVKLAALLHDVGDRKYLKPGEDGKIIVKNFLSSKGASDEVADKVQQIVNSVSFSGEKRDPEAVKEVLLRAPELAIVQDADRLDAIGAVGIGRCFTYTAAHGKEKEDQQDAGMEAAIRHFGEKLENIESMMKTNTGKAMARVRTDRLKVFRSWWEQETAGSDAPDASKD